MPPPRFKLRAVDLRTRAAVQDAAGQPYYLGPPQLRLSGFNRVVHCRLFTLRWELAGKRWYNLHQLQLAGFKLYPLTKA